MCTKEHSSACRLGNQVYQCTQVHIGTQEREREKTLQPIILRQDLEHLQRANWPHSHHCLMFGEWGSLFLPPRLQEGDWVICKCQPLGEKKALEIVWALLASVSPPEKVKNDILAGNEGEAMACLSSLCSSVWRIHFQDVVSWTLFSS